jgi:hypothetical protein
MSWDDVEDEWTAEITSAHPTRSGAHDEYQTALKMVGNRHSKGELVNLVTWLLIRLHNSCRSGSGVSCRFCKRTDGVHPEMCLGRPG